MKLTDREILDQINKHGYVIQEKVLSKDFIVCVKHNLLNAIETEKEKYGALGAQNYAMVMLCALYGEPFNQIFDDDELMRPFNLVLGEQSIVYAYTSSSMPPMGKNYSTRIHVDCPRLIPSHVTNMGATIALDDFTEENGATYFLPNSHTQEDAPKEDQFFKDAKRFLAPAGAVMYFNARLWHAGGLNKTKNWRHALTLNMCRPYMKQRIDIPRAMHSAGLDPSVLSEKSRQKLGFYCQPPSSMDEYYLPLEKRTYRQKTE